MNIQFDIHSITIFKRSNNSTFFTMMIAIDKTTAENNGIESSLDIALNANTISYSLITYISLIYL